MLSTVEGGWKEVPPRDDEPAEATLVLREQADGRKASGIEPVRCGEDSVIKLAHRNTVGLPSFSGNIRLRQTDLRGT